MMVFLHSMFSWELIALAAGLALLVYVRSQEKIKKGWLTFVSWIIIILAAISLICSIIFAIQHWSMGYYGKGRCMMMDKEMMQQRNMDMQKRNMDMQQRNMDMQRDSDY
jgi:hypothetical protein